MKINTNSQKVEKVLSRWIDKIYPSPEVFYDKLGRGKKLTIYHGVDPTAPHLHLGHSTNYLLLRELQDLGHKIILLIGDFTAQIGDPTGKLTARKALTKKQVLENCRTYKEQAGKILDFKSKKNPVKLKFNSRWLSKLTLEEIIKLAANFTHGQMVKRNMFQERLKKNEEIYLHEFLYPLLQGYDSVAMDVDAEVGGTDQTFNMLRGRDLMRDYRQKEKFVITTPLLINPITGRKLMSKSEGNFIALDDDPNEMYGKIMALPDETIVTCLKLCTNVSLVEIKTLEKKLNLKIINPRDAKIRMAREIVNIYYGKEVAEKAEEEFNNIFKEKKFPFQLSGKKINDKCLNVLELLVKLKLSKSKSEAKRLILQGGLKIDKITEKNWQKVVKIKRGMIVQVGKRKFVKII